MQKNRLMAVSSPLGEDVLLFRCMTATEQLGCLFEFQLELLSEQGQLNLAKVLGQNLTVRLELPAGGTRYFNGYASQFSQAGSLGRYTVYRTILRPWLWFLTRTADCRIFQEMTVPEIIKGVFREHGFTDFDEALNGSYPQREYCVQYRETDFNFVSRLMEEEGIYYYFKHEDGKHSLVLSDSYSSHDAVPGYEQIPFFPPDQHDHRKRDHIFDWAIIQQIQPGRYALNDFDFKVPKKNLRSSSSISRQHTRADFEIYDYPGEYWETAEGDNYSRLRIEELQAQYESVRGGGNAQGLAVGSLFELVDFPREDQNREYLVVSATYELRSNEYESDRFGTQLPMYHCAFTALDAQQPYRAPRITPKPLIRGPQTAIVVGKAGEEIWTDQYGRIKCQFHWDRYGNSNENSSCWIRVAQIWAGKRWGGMHIPRIGQEVIVEFLEGDPDRPIITGRVYNGDSMPPYDLPVNQTQSGVKSRSSKGGTPDNCNEIRFEDKKSEEQLLIHAEKNQDIEVENDEAHWVGRDRTKTIDRDETSHIKRDRTETVDRNETITIGNNRTEQVVHNEGITIGDHRTEQVGKNENITIGDNRIEKVGKNESITIGDSRTEQVGKDESIRIGGNRSEQVGKNENVSVGDNRSHSIGKNNTLNVGKILAITAGDQISLTTGSASIVMKKDGTITIQGKDITIKGSGEIVIRANKNVTIKGKKILEN